MAPPICHIRSGPVWAQLSGPDEAIHLVQEALTVNDPKAAYTFRGRRGQWDGKQRFLRRPSNAFLAGLTSRVISVLQTEGYDVKIEQDALPHAEPLIPGLLRSVVRDYQKQAVATLLQAGRAVLQSPTGSGKTLIGAELIRQAGHPALWIVPTRHLMLQVAKVLEQELGGRIGQIGDQVHDRQQITVAIINSLAKLGTEVFGLWPVLIADEAHHAAADMWARVLSASPAVLRAGLSGTAKVRQPDPVRQMRIEGLLGPTIVAVEAGELVEQGFLAKPHVVFIKVPEDSYPLYSEVREAVLPDWRLDSRRLQTMGAKLFDETERRGIIENRIRNRKLLLAAYTHVKNGDRVLVLCHSIAHSKALQAMWAASTDSKPCWRLDGFSPSSDVLRTLASFRVMTSGALLLATPFFREGVDLPEIDVLILAGGGASEIVSLQSIGRALRPRPDKHEVLIYDVWDGRRSSRAQERERDYLADHAETRLRTYNDQAFEVTFND